MVLGLTLFKICEVRKFPFAIAILDRRTLCITIPKNIILNKIKSSKIAKPSIICISQYIHTTCTTGKFCCPSVNFPFRKVHHFFASHHRMYFLKCHGGMAAKSHKFHFFYDCLCEPTLMRQSFSRILGTRALPHSLAYELPIMRRLDDKRE